MTIHLDKLRSVKSLQDLANILGFSPSKFAYLVLIQADSKKYHTFDISKKSGGFRTISAPEDRLKCLQARLSKVLEECHDDFLFQKGRRKKPAHGFLPERSIYTNSSPHVKSKWVLNIDIQNFFGSINFGRVRGFFLSSNAFALNESVATLLAQICCHQNHLPQGAPTSPIVSNLIAIYLDDLMLGLAARYRLTYTRYADDLTFSTSDDFPPEVAKFLPSGLVLGDVLIKQVEKAGFSINKKKTRLQSSFQRQEVTGLVTNKRVNVNSKYRAVVRAMLHRFTMYGEIIVNDRDGTNVYRGQDALSRLYGYMGFIKWIDSFSENNRIFSEYKRFILYSRFFINAKPVILCEGPTDVYYYKEAIKSLVDKFPEIAYKNSAGEIALKVEFYNYRNDAMNRILGLGGCGELKRFMQEMANYSKRFRRSGNSHPIIILVDDDQAGRDVKKLWEKHEKEFGDAYAKDRFNVKLVKISGINPDSVVENLLPPSLLAEKLDGRTFTFQSDFDNEIYYGKRELAEKVFLPKRNSIDYSAFEPTLAKIADLVHTTT